MAPAPRGPGDYTPVHGDDAHYREPDDTRRRTVGIRGGQGWWPWSGGSNRGSNGETHGDAEGWPAGPHPSDDHHPMTTGFDRELNGRVPPFGGGAADGADRGWDGFTPLAVVAWLMALLFVWVGTGWLGREHRKRTERAAEEDRRRRALVEEERKRKVGGRHRRRVWRARAMRRRSRVERRLPRNGPNTRRTQSASRRLTAPRLTDDAADTSPLSPSLARGRSRNEQARRREAERAAEEASSATEASEDARRALASASDALVADDDLIRHEAARRAAASRCQRDLDVAAAAAVDASVRRRVAIADAAHDRLSRQRREVAREIARRRSAEEEEEAGRAKAAAIVAEDRHLRRAQDDAYLASLAADVRKAEAAAAVERAERSRAEAAARWADAPEPALENAPGACIRLAFTFPDGARVTRRFAPGATVRDALDFALAAATHDAVPAGYRVALHAQFSETLPGALTLESPDADRTLEAAGVESGVNLMVSAVPPDEGRRHEDR